MRCVWDTIIRRPEKLIPLILSYKPTVDEFFRIRGNLRSSNYDQSYEVIARDKIALHAMSFSGLGSKAGSPTGGKKQTGKYRVDDRWYPDRIVSEILRLHGLLYGATLTLGDFLPVIESASERAFLYLDPPYYQVGNSLYQEGMSENDHERLRDVLMSSRSTWLLSYDDHPAVRSLYNHPGIRIETIRNTSTIVSVKRTPGKKNELLISNY